MSDPRDEEFSSIKAPPWSVEAEQAVLGGLLIQNSAFDFIADKLTAEHFFDSQHGKIYKAIASELKKDRPVDVLTVFAALEAKNEGVDLTYINQLAQGVSSAANIKRYAGIVIDRWKSRQLMAVGARAVEIASDESTPIDARIEQMQAEIGKLSAQVSQREPASLDEAMVRALTRLDERAEGSIRVFPTGLIDVDSMLGGGIRPGNLFIIAARPGQGKTAIAMTIALSMAKDRGVGVISMEMSEEEIMDRVLSGLGRVDLGKVQRPNSADSPFWSSITEAAEDAAMLKLFIDEQGGLTLHQVTAKARSMHRRGAIEVLVVDYIQLMDGTDSKTSRPYQLEEITRGFKKLAKEMGIAIIALAQVNRKVESGMPGLSDLKDSGALEQDADIVAFINRPIQTNPELGEEWNYYAQFRIAKNRQGRSGDVNLSYIGNETRFSSWAGPAPVKKSETKTKYNRGSEL